MAENTQKYEMSPEEYGKKVAQSIELNISRYDEWQQMIKSRDSVLSLEDDVDVPMKKILVMLSLMGVKTYFSCCGFNYNGQPRHKDHVYGNWQVLMMADAVSIEITRFLVDSLKDAGFRPYIEWKGFATSLTWLHGLTGVIPGWNKAESPHNSEVGVMFTKRVEDVLMNYLRDMKEVAVVFDFNDYMIKQYPNWQYPAKLPWTVSKQKLMDGDYDVTPISLNKG